MSIINKIILNGVEYDIGGSGGGLTDDVKAALDQLAQNVAYDDNNGSTYYNALHTALYPPANLSYISAVYTQSGAVFTTDTLDSLKDDLVVTAHYSNGTTQTITSYTLSGTLTQGTSTITVSYGGKTTTFAVIVSAITMVAYANMTDDYTSNFPSEYKVASNNNARRTIICLNAGQNKVKYTSASTDTSRDIYPIPLGSISSITVTADSNFEVTIVKYDEVNEKWDAYACTGGWVTSGTTFDTSAYSNNGYYFTILIYNNNVALSDVTITTS